MKNIDLNNNEVLAKLKESLGNIIDKKINENRINEKLNSIDKLSFSELKTLFEGVSSNLINSVSGKKIIARYAKIIKENRNLKDMYLLYESVANPIESKNPELFVNSMCVLSESIDKKNVEESKVKLSKIVAEAIKESKINADEFDTILDEKKELNEAIDYVFNNKRTAKNIHEHTEKVNLVLEQVKKNAKKGVVPDANEKSYDELLGDLNESISGLEGWEKEVVESIAMCELSGRKESELFESYKTDCLTLIESKISDTEDIAEKSRFTTMKESLTKKMFDESKSTENIMTLAELKNTLQLG